MSAIVRTTDSSQTLRHVREVPTGDMRGNENRLGRTCTSSGVAPIIAKGYFPILTGKEGGRWETTKRFSDVGSSLAPI
jgi:hypothetical protein